MDGPKIDNYISGPFDVRARRPHSPAEGIAAFQAYEKGVLPLLADFGGILERRLRNQDGTIEIHVVSFASDAEFQRFRNDPRRSAQARLLQSSSAAVDLYPVVDVA